MSAFMLQAFKQVFLQTRGPAVAQVRTKIYRNKISKTKSKSRGIKRHNGNFVHKGEILVTQYGLRFYPGENVGIDRANRLFALRDGQVIVSCEKLSPYSDSPLYAPVASGIEIKKKFFNILPTPLHGKFKLISEV